MVRICMECGAEVPAGSSYCPSCAKPVTEALNASGRGKVRPKGERKPLSLGLRIALVLVVIILVLQTVLFVYTVPWSRVTVNVHYPDAAPTYAAVYLDGHLLSLYYVYVQGGSGYNELGTWSVTAGTHLLEIDYKHQHSYPEDYYVWPDGVIDISTDFEVGFFSELDLFLQLT